MYTYIEIVKPTTSSNRTNLLFGFSTFLTKFLSCHKINKSTGNVRRQKKYSNSPFFSTGNVSDAASKRSKCRFLFSKAKNRNIFLIGDASFVQREIDRRLVASLEYSLQLISSQ